MRSLVTPALTLLLMACGAEGTGTSAGRSAGAGGSQAPHAGNSGRGGATAGASAGGHGGISGEGAGAGGQAGRDGAGAGGTGAGAAGVSTGGTAPSGGGGSGAGFSGAGTGAAGASAGAADGGRSSAGMGGIGPAGGKGGAPSAGAAGAHAGSAGSAGATPLGPLTVFLAGDSTVQSYTDTASTTDQAGWGQMLGALLQSSVKVDNRAIGGRTARRFVDEGHLDEILADIHAGDYLLVQFGTNDSNKTATYDLNGQTIPYYLDPETDFKTYLRMYLDGAKEHSATLALVTPPPRNSAYCTGGNGTGAWAAAMRELGASDGIAVLDLNQKAVDYLKAICPSPTPEDFFLLKSDGTVDGTHFQENGARILAGFVADEMKRVGLPLAAALR